MSEGVMQGGDPGGVSSSSLAAPLVSVVIVNYNYGRFLRRCLESVSAQSYRNLECIVVDNASTDDSKEVYASFVQSLSDEEMTRFRLLAMDDNLHQIGACMAAFDVSRGRFVAFVDADDYLLPACLGTHVQAHLVSATNPGFTCGDMLQAMDGEIVSMRSPGVSRHVAANPPAPGPAPRTAFACEGVPDCISEGMEALRRDLYAVAPTRGTRWPWSATSAFCFRRDAVDLMFRHVPSLKGNADSYLAHGISSLASSVVIDRPLAVYCGHGTNIFLRSAPLDGFRSYDAHDDVNDLLRLGTEIANCHLANMEYLANRLDGPDRYVAALRSTCSLAHSFDGGGDAYFSRLVEANRSRLSACFGEGYVDDVMGRRSLTKRLNPTRRLATLTKAFVGFVATPRRIPVLQDPEREVA